MQKYIYVYIYSYIQLKLGLTKFGDFHIVIYPIHVVGNTGKFIPLSITRVVSIKARLTCNSNESVLIAFLVCQRAPRVALSKENYLTAADIKITFYRVKPSHGSRYCALTVANLLYCYQQ